ncbi:MAG: M1 family aminopeptidase, partial [Candidatus Njordarchaeota archaeon]
FRIEHIKVQLKVYVYDKKIEGQATLALISLKDNLSTIELDAVDMTIHKVSSDGKNLDYMYDGEKLKIILGSALKKNQVIHVSISYEAKPKKGLYFILPDKHYPDRVPQVWSQGETEDNKHWIPLYDYPSMKCTSELIIYAPPEFTVLSNGRLIEVKEEESWKVWHYKMDKPHSTYLIALAIGLFDVEEDEVNGIKLIYAVPKGRKEDIPRSFSRTPDIIKFFSEYIGIPYPWNDYKQICVSEFIYGGMENTTITILTDYTLHDEKAHVDFESEPLVAHEAAHQWYGDLVTTKDWANIWINESFATYLEALYTRHWKGKEEFIYRMISNLDSYLKEYNTRYSRPIVTRVYKYPSEVFDAHSYPKGALVLHTLSSIIGEENFRKFLKTFLERYKYSNADTEDLRKTIEEIIGKDMEWFFDQYVYNAGHPVLSISYSYDPETKVLKITFKQTQKDDCWDVYRLPIDIVYVQGNDKTSKTLWITQKEQTFYIPTEKKVDYVCFDPEFKVFAVLDVKDKLEQLIKKLEYDSVYCQIRAVRKLADFKSSKAIEALKNILLSDKFWGIRAEAALALGKIGSAEALNALLESEKQVTHPKVRRHIARALGNFKDPTAAEVLAKILTNKEESYYVRSEAATSLGKTKWEKAYKYLTKALDTPSHNDVITIGSIRGLSELGTDDAFDKIKNYVKLGKPTLVRAAAVVAMAKFVEKKEAMEIIHDAAKDDNYRIRVSAIMAAAETMSPKFLPMLESLAYKDTDERIRRFAREISTKIRRHLEKGTEYKQLREEIEKVKEENRRLLDRLAKIETKM